MKKKTKWCLVCNRVYYCIYGAPKSLGWIVVWIVRRRAGFHAALRGYPPRALSRGSFATSPFHTGTIPQYVLALFSSPYHIIFHLRSCGVIRTCFTSSRRLLPIVLALM
jgi:hypothetical protein